MKARLDVVLRLMERLSGEFKELKESFKELKGENAVLRKEILGIGATAGSSGRKGMGLMKKTTLRELVEEIQFDVKSLNAKVERSLHDDEFSGNPKESSGEKRGEQDLPSADNGVDTTKEPIECFPVVEIQLKTIADQRDWIKKSFAEYVKWRSVSEGASLWGRTLQTISSSIVPNPASTSTSCTLKLCKNIPHPTTNYLSYALTVPKFHFWSGSKTSGPYIVDPHVSEVFTFQGPGRGCWFLCSFGLSSSLRLTIFSYTDRYGSIQLGMAFTPQDVPTDPNLHSKLTKMMTEPDVWMHSACRDPMEPVINHGKLYARGHMTRGKFSVINIDIMTFSDVPFPVHEKKKSLKDGESICATLFSKNLVHKSSLNKLACIIEMGNCLNCTLRNRSGFFRNGSRNNFLPSEILPFHRERCFTSDDTTAEAMFSYEIESTDLCFVVALRLESGNNSFAVAFAQLPVEANRDNLVALMDPKAWKTHLYKKYSHAKDGEQMVQIRNIRASVAMTEGAESLLKIRIFAV